MPLHVLILNAGIMAHAEAKSNYGTELHFATNHVGHHLLTTLLLPTLRATADSATDGSFPVRVVAVSARLYEHFPVNFNDVNFSQPNNKYDKWKAYAQSKTANILFARQLNKMMEEKGSKVRAFSLHPGVIRTKLQRHTVPEDFKFLTNITPVILKSPEQGAATTLYAALSKDLQDLGGSYLDDCRILKTLPFATDLNVAKQLWEFTEKIIANAKE